MIKANELQEEWRPIPYFIGYEVSNWGRYGQEDYEQVKETLKEWAERYNEK